MSTGTGEEYIGSAEYLRRFKIEHNDEYVDKAIKIAEDWSSTRLGTAYVKCAYNELDKAIFETNQILFHVKMFIGADEFQKEFMAIGQKTISSYQEVLARKGLRKTKISDVVLTNSSNPPVTITLDAYIQYNMDLLKGYLLSAKQTWHKPPVVVKQKSSTDTTNKIGCTVVLIFLGGMICMAFGPEAQIAGGIIMLASGAFGLIWAAINDVAHVHDMKADVEEENDPVLKKMKQDLLDLEVQQRLNFDGLN